MKIYTVYLKKNAEKPNETAEFIPESFLWWAFIPGANLLWAMRRQCWLYLLLIFLTYYVFWYVASGSEIFNAGLFSSTYGYPFYLVFRMILLVFLGANGYDFWRKKLESKGYEMVGVVVASSELEAQRRYFENVGI